MTIAVYLDKIRLAQVFTYEPFAKAGMEKKVVVMVVSFTGIHYFYLGNFKNISSIYPRLSSKH